MRQLDNHLEKLDQHLSSYIRINSKWSRNLNAERTQPHTCQKKTWMNLSTIWVQGSGSQPGTILIPGDIQQCLVTFLVAATVRVLLALSG